MRETLEVRSVSGAALEGYRSALARLRIEIFRDFPYLYDGDMAYEERYVQTYVDAPESLMVLAFDAGEIVGASTGIPLEYESEEFRAPFLERGYDAREIFYCGESLLRKDYRGRGLYRRFFAGREAHARELGRFSTCAFCAVARPLDHPARPRNYEPLDGVWRHFGYEPHPELVAHFSWKDVGKADETAKPMTFWLKSLRR